MIKGCAKRVVVVRDIDSNFFEEAFFIVKQGSGRINSENDYIGEANRIVHYDLPDMSSRRDSLHGVKIKSTGRSGGTGGKKHKPHRRGLLRDALVFMFGFAVSLVFCTFIYYSGIGL